MRTENRRAVCELLGCSGGRNSFSSYITSQLNAGSRGEKGKFKVNAAMPKLKTEVVQGDQRLSM
jgi:hypothetical protein